MHAHCALMCPQALIDAGYDSAKAFFWSAYSDLPVATGTARSISRSLGGDPSYNGGIITNVERSRVSVKILIGTEIQTPSTAFHSSDPIYYYSYAKAR